MLGFVKSVLRYLLIRVGRVLSFILFDLTVHGKENLPAPNQHPLIVIANHFSWFDAPILAIHLPFYLAFVVATESLRNWWVRHFINLFDGIPIWRGQVVSGDLNVYAGSVFMGIDSPLGPLYLGFGYANSDNKAVYLYLGRP